MLHQARRIKEFVSSRNYGLYAQHSYSNGCRA